MLASLLAIAVLHWAVLLIPGFNFVLIGQLAPHRGGHPGSTGAGRVESRQRPIPSNDKTMSTPYRAVLAVLLALASWAGSAHAEVTEQEAIQAQLASAMASADYAATKCPSLVIDRQKIESLTRRSGMTPAQLKASEDYVEQRDVIASLDKSKPVAMICYALSRAHNGYARGVIGEK
ncbi:MAG: hypothetical protein EON92_07950 [Burkholderiales bacterium]|nr:MAG: hypothetical protein EON92_07950 [Burkholderiales bacterium]